MDEKPEQPPGASGDAVEAVDAAEDPAETADPADPWVPAADDPLFGPLNTLPASIRRPVWTSDAGIFDRAATVQPLDSALVPAATPPTARETGSVPRENQPADEQPADSQPADSAPPTIPGGSPEPPAGTPPETPSTGTTLETPSTSEAPETPDDGGVTPSRDTVPVGRKNGASGKPAPATAQPPAGEPKPSEISAAPQASAAPETPTAPKTSATASASSGSSAPSPPSKIAALPTVPNSLKAPASPGNPVPSPETSTAPVAQASPESPAGMPSVGGDAHRQRNQTVPSVPRAAAPGVDGTGRGPSGGTAPSGRLLSAGRLTRPAVIIGVVVLVAVAAIAVLAGRDQDDAKGPSATPATVSAASPTFVNSARTDSDPVTAAEFFGAPRATLNLHTYTRLAQKLDTGCPGLTGELVNTLPGDRCRQLVRAVYLSEPDTSGRRVLAATSVLVLDEASTAASAAKAVTEGRGGVPALPVPAESLPGAAVTNPTADNSWRTAPVSGHYLIVIQLAYTDGAEGAPTDPALTTARRDLALLASQPISQRVLVGHGPR